MLSERILKIWYNLVRFGVYFDQILFWRKFPKINIFSYKTNYFSYTFDMRL